MANVRSFAMDIFSFVEKKNRRNDFIKALTRYSKEFEKSVNLNYYYRAELKEYRKAIDSIIKDKNGHNLRFSQHGDLVAYTVKGKHIKTKLGRYLNKNYRFNKLEFSHRIHYLIDDIMSLGNPNFIETNSVIYKGKDIVDLYKSRKDIFNSCMGGTSGVYTAIYEINTDKVSMIVVGDFKARALIWIDDDGNKIMDRVYPSGTKYTNMLREWAIKNDIVYRDRLDSHVETGSKIRLSDNSIRKITLKTTKNLMFPFADTFRYGYINTKTPKGSIVLQNAPPAKKEYIKLNSTYGSFNRDKRRKTSKILKKVKCCKCKKTYKLKVCPHDLKYYCHYHFWASRVRCDRCGDIILTKNSFGYYYCKKCYYR